MYCTITLWIKIVPCVLSAEEGLFIFSYVWRQHELVQNVNIMCHSWGGRNREAWRDTFHIPQRGFLSGCWSQLLQENMGDVPEPSMDLQKRPGCHRKAKRHRGGQGQGKCRAESEQNYLWIGTAVVCVTPRSSLLWSILICYSLNTLNIFYVSFNLSSPEAGLSTHLPIHPKN